MSDVYSDLNIKNGAKIVLGESGVSIDSSGCVVLDSGCTFDLSDVATRCYVDEEISKICTDGGVCGVYLPATTDDSGNYYVGGSNVRITDEISFVKDVSCSTDDITEYTVSGKLIAGGNSVELVSGCMVIIDAPGGACIKSNTGVEIQSGCSLFYFPDKGNGSYTLATTDDVSGLCDADYLKVCCSTAQNVSGLVCFSHGINVSNLTLDTAALATSKCFVYFSGALFQLPNKQQCGTYTLATTEDIPSGETVSGDYLPATNESLGDTCSFYNVDKIVQFSKACVYLNNPDINAGRIHFDSVENKDLKASFVEGGWTNSGCSFLDLGACCVTFYSGGACFQFPVKDKIGTPYTLATTEDIASGGTVIDNYVKTDCTADQCLEGNLYVPGLEVNSPIVFNGPCVFNVQGRVFSIPQKECGEYTLVTTDDISGCGSVSGCTYPTSYPLYSSCCVVGGLCYDNCRISLNSCSDLSMTARCSVYFMCDACYSAFCVFFPSCLPYMGGKVESTIVTSPGYSDSGCGLQICVLTQSEYSSMSQHGMTTLYFIKPEI